MKRRTSALYDWTHQRRTKEDVCRNIIGESGLSVIEKERNGVDGFNKANSTIKSQIPLSRLERARGWFGGSHRPLRHTREGRHPRNALMNNAVLYRKTKHTSNMKALKTNRFDVEENSWNFDIMENITSLLEMIPVEDRDIDVPKILYDGLLRFVSLSFVPLSLSSVTAGMWLLVAKWIWPSNTYPVATSVG